MPYVNTNRFAVVIVIGANETYAEVRIDDVSKKEGQDIINSLLEQRDAGKDIAFLHTKKGETYVIASTVFAMYCRRMIRYIPEKESRDQETVTFDQGIVSSEDEYELAEDE